MNHLNKLYGEAYRPIHKGAKNKSFLTDSEFKERQGKITILVGYCREVQKKLDILAKHDKSHC
jgi:hypothetical protein